MYYDDVRDHLFRVVDMIDTMRDYLAGSLDIYTTQQTQRINHSMQRLTAIATIFLPLTFITGIYGMNFANMPETQWTYGFYAVLALSARRSVSGCSSTSTGRKFSSPPGLQRRPATAIQLLVAEKEKTQVPRAWQTWRCARTHPQPSAPPPEGLRLPHRRERISAAGFRSAVYLVRRGAGSRDWRSPELRVRLTSSWGLRF